MVTIADRKSRRAVIVAGRLAPALHRPPSAAVWIQRWSWITSRTQRALCGFAAGDPRLFPRDQRTDLPVAKSVDVNRRRKAELVVVNPAPQRHRCDAISLPHLSGGQEAIAITGTS